jgi:hypothetical protein
MDRGMYKKLVDEWTDGHKLLTTAGAAAVGPAPNLTSKCCRNGVCSCSAAAKPLNAMVEQWQSYAKSHLEKTGGAMRPYYNQGAAVMELQQEGRPSLWFSTSWLNLTSLEGSFMQLQFVEGDFEQRCANAHGATALQILLDSPTVGCISLYRAFELVDANKPCSAKWWKTVRNDIVVDTFVPGLVHAVPVVALETNQFWDGFARNLLKPKRVGRRARAPRAQQAPRHPGARRAVRARRAEPVEEGSVAAIEDGVPSEGEECDEGDENQHADEASVGASGEDFMDDDGVGWDDSAWYDDDHGDIWIPPEEADGGKSDIGMLPPDIEELEPSGPAGVPDDEPILVCLGADTAEPLPAPCSAKGGQLLLFDVSIHMHCTLAFAKISATVVCSFGQGHTHFRWALVAFFVRA